MRGALSGGWKEFAKGILHNLVSAKRFFGYEQVANADCEYPLDRNSLMIELTLLSQNNIFPKLTIYDYYIKRKDALC